MLWGKYSQGNIYLLNIPEDFSDLYELPEGVLNQIRRILCADLKVRIEAPAKVSLFVYDNNTIIVESFLDEAVNIKVITPDSSKTLTDLVSGETLNASAVQAQNSRRMPRQEASSSFSITLEPHTYRVFSF